MNLNDTFWKVLDSDSRPVEAATAASCMAMAIGAILTGAPWAEHPVIPWIWLGCTMFHFWTSTTEMCRVRQLMACISVVVFALLGWQLLRQHGVEDRPAAPALIVAAIWQCWVYLALESKCVDHRRANEPCS